MRLMGKATGETPPFRCLPLPPILRMPVLQPDIAAQVCLLVKPMYASPMLYHAGNQMPWRLINTLSAVISW